jgi:uncharacterized protein (DUF1810 family)
MIIGIWNNKDLMISSILHHYQNKTIEKVLNSDATINWVETYEFFPVIKDSEEVFNTIKDAYEYHCDFVLNNFDKLPQIFNHKEYGLGTWDIVILQSLGNFYLYSEKAKELLTKMVAMMRERLPDYCLSALSNYRGTLNRFISAQDSGNIEHGTVPYATALEEIKSGRKKSHWIWYVFPQMKGLGHSELSDYFGIDGREEAKAYIQHPILRERLIEATQAVLDNEKNAYEIFGSDTIKFRSCMLLFASVSDIPVFKQILKKYNWN